MTSDMDAGSALARPSPFSLLSIVRTLWKRKLLALLVWLAVTGVGAVVAMRWPRIYRSEAVILIESQRIPERFVAATVNVDLQSRLNSIGQQILSRSRLLDIIQRFNLYGEARSHMAQEEIVEAMKRDIKILPMSEWMQRRREDAPNAFKITYQGPNPSVVAQVCAQLAELFINESVRARESEAEGTSQFLDTQMGDARKRLEEQEAKLTSYKVKYSGELPEQETALIANVSRLQQQLVSVQDSIGRAEQSKLMLNSALDMAQASEAALAQIVEQAGRESTAPGTPAAAARSRYDVLTEQLETLKQQYTDEHPDIRRLRAELAALEKQQARPEAAAPAAVAAAPARPLAPEMAQTLLRERERVENLKAQVSIINKQLEVQQQERQRIVGELNAVQARIEKLPLREQELATVMRDYEISKTNYRSLLDKKLSSDMATEMERRQKAERFALLDPARVPEKPIKPDPMTIAFAGSGLGLVLGLAVAFGRESKANVILGEWELPVGVGVLGRVPAIEPAARRINGSRGRGKAMRRWAVAAIVAALVLLAGGLAAVFLLGWSPF